MFSDKMTGKAILKASRIGLSQMVGMERPFWLRLSLRKLAADL
jgi:hypothetical protein